MRRATTPPSAVRAAGWERGCRRQGAKREWDSAAAEAKERATHERRAKALARERALAKGDTFHLRMEGGWEHLRVLEVSDAISNRANFGAVKVYRCEAVGSGKIYPRIDLSSWRGAEGACQVKGVKRAPQWGAGGGDGGLSSTAQPEAAKSTFAL